MRSSCKHCGDTVLDGVCIACDLKPTDPTYGQVRFALMKATDTLNKLRRFYGDENPGIVSHDALTEIEIILGGEK